MRLFAVLLIITGVAGCSTIPLSSALKLRQLNPLTADPKAIRIAVRLPDGIRVREDGAVMEITARRTDTGLTEKGRFVFRQQTSATADAADGLLAEADTHFEIFRIADDDMARLRRLQETMKVWKAEAPDDAGGSLSIQISGCRTAKLPPGPVVISTFLRTDPAEPFFTVMRNVDLRSAFNEGGQAHILPLCDSGAG